MTNRQSADSVVLRSCGTGMMDMLAVSSPEQATLDRGQRPTSNRIAGLDGIRTVAVLIVFLSHYSAAAFPEEAPWLDRVFPGMLGVTLFFVISGFLISSLLLAEFGKTGSIHLRHFYIRRLLRLTPALYVYVAIVLLAYVAADGRVQLWDFVAAVTYVSNYYQLSPAANMYYMPVWSLAIEEHFYLLFPLLMLLTVRRSVRMLTAAVVAGIVASFFWRMVVASGNDIDWLFIYWRTDTRLDSLLFGVLLTCVVALPEGAVIRNMIRSKPALVLSVILMAISVGYRDEFFRMSARYTVQGLALMLMIGYVVLSHERLSRWARRVLELQPGVYISKISYPLYLWHLTILKFVQHELGGVTPAAVVLCAAASFAAAASSYHFVELPFLRLRRKFGSHALA